MSSSTYPSDTSTSSSSSLPGGVGANYIEHIVSRMDTLAGVAIKYGVEVADVKRMNGLVTDLQMFALKSLRIPLPGRHPPSPSLVNGPATPGESVDQILLCGAHADILGSFQSVGLKSSQRVSPAMSSLRGYYGLKTPNHKGAIEGAEMAVYNTSRAHYLEEGTPPKPSPVSDPPPSRHRKTRSLANGFPDDGILSKVFPDAEERGSVVERSNEKSMHRHQKSDSEFCFRTPEMLLKDDISGSSSFLPKPKTGKGLALRPKSASRTTLPADTDAGYSKPVPLGLGDILTANGLIMGVRKSSSTSNLQDQEKSDSAFIWPTAKRNLKPDFQARSAATIAKPIFDGLPKPITSRRNKAAVD